MQTAMRWHKHSQTARNETNQQNPSQNLNYKHSFNYIPKFIIQTYVTMNDDASQI